MGFGRWRDSDWDRYATKNIRSKATVDAIYSSRSLAPELDPKGIKVRESCDSADNPNSSPLIVALDVTGSMGYVLYNLGLYRSYNLVKINIYRHKVV
jgi:hypothetical protein